MIQRLRRASLLSLLALAPIFSAPPALADEEADHAAIRAIKSAYEEAVSTNDLSKLIPYLSKDVSGVVVTGNSLHGVKEFQDYWNVKVRGWIGANGTYKVEIIPAKTEFFGDLALSQGTANETLRLSTGQEFRYTSAWTTICRREEGVWKLLRLQATMDPINNPIVDARLKGYGIQYGAGGIVTGLVSGILIMVGVRRSREAKKQGK